jgi:hypothetical protein
MKLIGATRLRLIAGSLALLGLGACSSTPLAPGEDDQASMRVGTNAMTATTLGDSIIIDAAVVNALGAAIPHAEIHWELSTSGILEVLGNGRFRVVREGQVQVAAVWPKDPSVRAAVNIKVDAGALMSACISRTDQATGTQVRKCAQQRVVVRAAALNPTLAVAPEGVSRVPGGDK